MGATTLFAFAFLANTLTQFVSASDVEPVTHEGSHQHASHLVHRLVGLNDQLDLVTSVPNRLEGEHFHELQVLTTLGKLVYALGETYAYAKLSSDLYAQLVKDSTNGALQVLHEDSVKHVEDLTKKHQKLLKKLRTLLGGDVTQLHHFYTLLFDVAYLEGFKTDLKLDAKKLQELLHLLVDAFGALVELHELDSVQTNFDFHHFNGFLKDVGDLGLLLDLWGGLNFLLNKNDGQKKLADELAEALHGVPTWTVFQDWLKDGHGADFGLLLGWEGASHPFDVQEGWDFDNLGDVGLAHKLVSTGLERREHDVLTLLQADEVA